MLIGRKVILFEIILVIFQIYWAHLPLCFLYGIFLIFLITKQVIIVGSSYENQWLESSQKQPKYKMFQVIYSCYSEKLNKNLILFALDQIHIAEISLLGS